MLRKTPKLIICELPARLEMVYREVAEDYHFHVSKSVLSFNSPLPAGDSINTSILFSLSLF